PSEGFSCVVSFADRVAVIPKRSPARLDFPREARGAGRSRGICSSPFWANLGLNGTPLALASTIMKSVYRYLAVALLVGLTGLAAASFLAGQSPSTNEHLVVY